MSMSEIIIGVELEEKTQTRRLKRFNEYTGKPYWIEEDERYYAIKGYPIRVPISDQGCYADSLPTEWDEGLENGYTLVVRGDYCVGWTLLGVSILEARYLPQELIDGEVATIKLMVSDRLKQLLNYEGPIGVYLVESSI